MKDIPQPPNRFFIPRSNPCDQIRPVKRLAVDARRYVDAHQPVDSGFKDTEAAPCLLRPSEGVDIKISVTSRDAVRYRVKLDCSVRLTGCAV